MVVVVMKVNQKASKKLQSGSGGGGVEVRKGRVRRGGEKGGEKGGENGQYFLWR
jgi:hypothetical protein